MIPVQSYLQYLVSQLQSTTIEIESVVKVLNKADLTHNEKMHKVGNLMLAIDLTFRSTRKQFDQIAIELRKNT